MSDASDTNKHKKMYILTVVKGSRCAIFQKKNMRVLALWGDRLSQELQCSAAPMCKISNMQNNGRIAYDLVASGIRFNSGSNGIW